MVRRDCGFSTKTWGCALRHEEKYFNHDDLADVWRSAQRRRFDDLYVLLAQLFKHRPQLKLSLFFWR
jgi:hypothetical protein